MAAGVTELREARPFPNRLRRHRHLHVRAEVLRHSDAQAFARRVGDYGGNNATSSATMRWDELEGWWTGRGLSIVSSRVRASGPTGANKGRPKCSQADMVTAFKRGYIKAHRVAISKKGDERGCCRAFSSDQIERVYPHCYIYQSRRRSARAARARRISRHLCLSGRLTLRSHWITGLTQRHKTT